MRGNNVRYLRSLGVRIGKQCEILTPAGNFGTEPWLVELGDRVTVSAGVLFYTHDGASRVIRHEIAGGAPWGNRFGTIVIRDNSFIGSQTILMPNINIGPNSIVGAGSVVHRDVAPNTVAAGVPAREICSLEDYKQRYRTKMVPIAARTREELRRELTERLWGERR